MNGPLVSVILPTYRRGHVIRRALQSVLTQSYRNLEVIVLDDVPKDDTEEVVRSFNDPRVRYVAYPDRRGVSAARNQGFDLAKGKYLAFQDSDDEWLADKLAYQVARMEALPENVALTQAAILRFQGGGTQADYYLSELPPERERQLEGILPINMTSFTQAWLLRKSAIDQVGHFDERLPLWEDWELMIRICEKYAVDIDRKPVAVVYDTPGGLTAQDKMRPAAFRLIVEKHRALMQRYPRTLARNFYSMSKMDIFLGGQLALGRKAAMESLRLQPGQLKVWILLFTSFTGAMLPSLISRTQARVRTWLFRAKQRWYRRTDPFNA